MKLLKKETTETLLFAFNGGINLITYTDEGCSFGAMTVLDLLRTQTEA